MPSRPSMLTQTPSLGWASYAGSDSIVYLANYLMSDPAGSGNLDNLMVLGNEYFCTTSSVSLMLTWTVNQYQTDTLIDLAYWPYTSVWLTITTCPDNTNPILVQMVVLSQSIQQPCCLFSKPDILKVGYAQRLVHRELPADSNFSLASPVRSTF